MLGISLNNSSPIYEQLTSKIEYLVLHGLLEPNEILPSVREMATNLAINPNTVQKAYTYLEQIGVCYSVNGKGRFVTGDVEALRQRKILFEASDFENVVKKIKDLGASKEFLIEKINSLYEEGEK
ncbi:MAG: GntR family transcriptional regulator [Ruminococcaceae bacterium]|nr:GntR family transcriptional regulator [Oscillospiraceae bacterium]